MMGVNSARTITAPRHFLIISVPLNVWNCGKAGARI
jgi:hypothetical protein